MRQPVVVLAAAIVLLTIAVGGLFLLQDQPGNASAGGGSEPVADPVGGDSLLVAAPVERSAITEAIPPEASQAEPEAAVELAPEASSPIVLHGAAIRQDEGGLEYHGEDGSFVLSTVHAGKAQTRVVEILGGAWSTELPASELVQIRELVLGDVPITLERREFVVPGDRFLELRGLGLRSIVLHVRSAANEAPLSGIDVWPAMHIFASGLRHPGAEPEGTPLVRNVTSPVTIAPNKDSWRGSRQVFVHAPGHAWGSIDLDHSSGGERVLLLAPATSLTVELLGSADWLEPKIRLWPPDASRHAAYPFAEQPSDDQDRATFTALPPGTYLVSVERGWATVASPSVAPPWTSPPTTS